jgi:hypothetical protein
LATRRRFKSVTQPHIPPSPRQHEKRPRGGQTVEEFDYYTYYDSPEFKAYAAVIERIIHEVEPIPATATHAERPGEITVRRIHEILDFHARREWTQDALDSLKSIERVGVLITRYRRIKGVPPAYPKRARSDAMRFLFPLKAEDPNI